MAYWAPTDLGCSSFFFFSFFFLNFFLFFFKCPIFLPFHIVHGVLKARILKWFAIPFSKWTMFCQNSPPRPVHLEWPYMAWLSFIELYKAVVQVTRLASFLRLWFQSVVPLMPCLSTYCLTEVPLTLGVEYLFTVPPSKCSHCSLLWI